MSRKRYYGLAQSKRAHKMKAAYAAGVNTYSSGSSIPSNAPVPRITGAMLAANVFEAYGGDEDCIEVADCDSSESFDSDNLVPDEPYQLEFDLFNQEEIEQDLRQVIRRYENALEKMGMYALQWHWLQEDVEKYGQIEKMFKDMQLCRRLCGGGPPHDLNDYNDQL